MKIEDRIKYLSARSATKRWYQKWWLILLALLVLAVLVYVLSFVFLFWHLAQNPAEAEMARRQLESGNLGEQSKVDPIMINMIEGHNNYYLGGDQAPFTLVLFSDYACSYCRQTSEVVEQLIIKYGDRIKIIIRDYPIISDDSLSLALAARCAGQQNKYWPMYRKLFELQGTFSVSSLNTVAQLVGVGNLAEFSDCLDRQIYLNEVRKDFSDAQVLGIKGTPTWYMNGMKVVDGHISFANWTTLLDKIIK